ncbi:hypothetical protein [Sphingomicrobium astaxanthinifaciens]|uniref:hypothetical protein n=1 Tax=Sphingomicrobium astaxanthinifaciens TaxID=1227949 RepID=UPI001FCBF6AC|nr:hypothetical protein [Sphingomicrobium astaxanthinifaciens]MCJ7421249.1 hypothetical protein [Sphingomicrobium astaxanthinifaciens]
MNAPRRKARIWAVAAGLAGLAAGGCERDPPAAPPGEPAALPDEAAVRGPETLVAPVSPVATADGWSVERSEAGLRLVYRPEGEAAEDPVAVLTCLVGGGLIVRLPRIAPLGEEDRLRIGAGEAVAELDADPTRETGGIAGRGPAPSTLAAMLAQGLTASYGAASTGVLPPAPDAAIAAIRSACN